MKIIALLILAFGLQVHAKSFSQTVSLSFHDAPLKKVFREIRKQTGYNFLYTTNQLKEAGTISIDVKNADLQTVLQLCFEKSTLSFAIVNKTIVVQPKKQSQLSSDEPQQASLFQTVRGKVTDDKGVPLAGVSVVIKGTSSGTTTNDKGEFLIDIPQQASQTLVFSFIGMEPKEVNVSGRSVVDIVLTNTVAQQEEFVIVAYGTKKKVHLTGAVSSVGGKELTEAPVANISNSLAGRLPGVVVTNPNGRPGSGSSLSIRGVSTLIDPNPNAPNRNAPLVVVDGVLRDGFTAFDPNEIESISVLKDAAATAVYGARANNGVFLVTTKRGKAGKPTISYTGTVGIQQPTRYPRVMSGFEYASAYNTGLINAGFNPANPADAGRFYSADVLGKLERGEQGSDWYKVTFKKKPLIETHNLTITGGTDAIKYFVSLGTVDQDGMYDNINYKAYKFRSNVDAKISNSLTIGVDLEGRQENNNQAAIDANAIFEHAARLNPTITAYYPSGRPANTGGEHSGEEIKNSGYDRLLQNTFQGTLSASQKLDVITKGLSANARVSFGKQYGFRKTFALPYTMYNEDAAGNVTGTKIVGGLPSLGEAFTQTYSKFYNISLNYQRSFGRHEISGMLLYEQTESQGDQFNAFRQDFPTIVKDELFVSGTVNQDLNGSSFINDSRRGLVGRVGYIFNNKYLLEGSFRYDGSYIFPKGKQFGLFPAASAGWRISEEAFFKNSSALQFISNLKVRGSWGIVGNDRIFAFQYQDAYTIATTPGGGAPSIPTFSGQPYPLAYYGVYPNPNVTWEKAYNSNIGLEAGFMKNKLSIEFDYFNKDTRDILWARTRSVPATFGRSLPNENYARVRNRGFELVINYQAQTGAVQYKVSANGSFSKNKVLMIDDPANALDFQKQLGRPIGIRTGYEALGFFQSQAEIDTWMDGRQFGVRPRPGQIKYADLNKDGVIDSKDQKVLSTNTATPRVMYGLSGNIRWKNLDVSLLLQGAAARNFLLTTNGRIAFSGGIFKYMLDAWSPDNTDARYPSLVVGSTVNNDRVSDIWITNGSYLRLKSLNLGYTFSRLSIKNAHLNSVRVFLSGYNLITWSRVKDYDPEAESSAAAYYPQQQTFSGGVNITF